MKLLFYLITFIPIYFIRSAVNLYTKLNLHKTSSVYKLTMCNIKICFPELSEAENALLARQSFIETFISAYETIQSWARPIHISGKMIFRIENNYLISQNIDRARESYTNINFDHSKIHKNYLDLNFFNMYKFYM